MTVRRTSWLLYNEVKYIAKQGDAYKRHPWRRGHEHGFSVSSLAEDEQSDVRSLPLNKAGWKIRHHRPDIKERPSTGGFFVPKVGGGYKNKTVKPGLPDDPFCQLLLARRCCNKLKIMDAPHASKHSHGETPRRCRQKQHVSINGRWLMEKWDSWTRWRARERGNLSSFRGDGGTAWGWFH